MASVSDTRPSENDITTWNGDEIENEAYWDASEHFEHEGSYTQQVVSPPVLPSPSVPASPDFTSTLPVPSASFTGPSSSSDFESISVSSASASGLVEDCSTYIPDVNSRIWDKLPAGLITDQPESSQLDMDPEVLAERKGRFGNIARALLRRFRATLMQFAFFSSMVDWTLIPVTFYSAVFLLYVSEDLWVNFVVDSTIDEFIYLSQAPDFKPGHLLLLPRWSKKDNRWGIYMSMFSDKPGNIVAWYFGSALSFGGPYSVCGVISRLLSYFRANKDPIEHERWIARRDLQMHFRKVAVVTPKYANLHKVYWLALETFFIVCYTMDTSLTWVTQFRSKDIGKWVREFRDNNNIPSFESSVQGLNRALPLKQGVTPDRRFAKKKCSNPIANCPAGTDIYPMKEWKNMIPGHIFTGQMLCSACDSYYKYFEREHGQGKHRSQEIIDSRLQLEVAKSQPASWCSWCFRNVGDDTVWTRHLGMRLCEICFLFGQRGGAPAPIPGLHLDGNHRFACQQPGCTKQDKSLALEWFLTKSGVFELGDLRCETCHYSLMQNSAAFITSLQDDPSIVPHRFTINDLHNNGSGRRINRIGQNRKGFLEYCKRFCNVDVTGESADFLDTVHRLRSDLVYFKRPLDVAARDRWFQVTTTEDPKTVLLLTAKVLDKFTPSKPHESPIRASNLDSGTVAANDSTQVLDTPVSSEVHESSSRGSKLESETVGADGSMTLSGSQSELDLYYAIADHFPHLIEPSLDSDDDETMLLDDDEAATPESTCCSPIIGWVNYGEELKVVEQRAHADWAQYVEHQAVKLERMNRDKLTAYPRRPISPHIDSHTLSLPKVQITSRPLKRQTVSGDAGGHSESAPVSKRRKQE
ncbi:hypothetical protein LTR70_009219 [Exophiala xenobiotica]|uniref:Uncharacterized protein n=1 Tax=Lithohypha guttulata TaxID=1690604 RepID=A0ABR0KGR5_9EURO|nr:hypothetical protein LTR24_002718 [Lithohypha guttulata]KAK5310792.1 hypothetical protein LTR70_009219 [Exophiala xenobiotica]